MKSIIERYCDGENYIKIEKSPYYIYAGKDKGVDKCCRTMKIPFTRYKICVRRTNITGFNNDGIKRIISIFGTKAKVDKFKVTIKRYNREHTYYIDDMIWVLNPDKDFVTTNYKNVMYSRAEEKYYGYSHRGVIGFGIGDNLFDEKNEDLSIYYKSLKYRLKFLWSIIAHIKSPIDFQWAVERGIKYIVPFRRRGTKIIETKEEALLAAKHIAEYLN
jgi:hypothetical protein